MSTEDELRNCRQGKTQMKKRIAQLERERSSFNTRIDYLERVVRESGLVVYGPTNPDIR